MSPLVTYVLLCAIVLYAVVLIYELITRRHIKGFALKALILCCVVVYLHAVTGFPTPKRAFGGGSSLFAILAMFCCVILGMIAHYFFYLKERFSLKTFLRPFLISPIVLLPLLASMKGNAQLESIELIAFAILAFQNGFFWREVLEHAKPEE